MTVNKSDKLSKYSVFCIPKMSYAIRKKCVSNIQPTRQSTRQYIIPFLPSNLHPSHQVIGRPYKTVKRRFVASPDDLVFLDTLSSYHLNIDYKEEFKQVYTVNRVVNRVSQVKKRLMHSIYPTDMKVGWDSVWYGPKCSVYIHKKQRSNMNNELNSKDLAFLSMQYPIC